MLRSRTGGILLICTLALAAAPAAQQPGLAAMLREAEELIRRGDLTEAQPLLERIAQQAAAASDAPAQALALRGLAQVLYQRGQFTAAIDPLQRALPLASGAPLVEGRIRDLLGSVEVMRGRVPESRQQFDQAAAIFERIDAPAELSTVLRNMTHLNGFTFDERYAMLERALQLARRAGDRYLEGMTLHHWGAMLLVQNDYAGALERFEPALALIETTGAPRDKARAATSLGRAFEGHGLPERAEALYRRALQIQESIGDEIGMSQTCGLLGLSFRSAGRYAEATTFFERSLVHARRTSSPGQINSAIANLGIAYLDHRQPARAVEVLEPAIRENRFPDAASGVYPHFARALSAVGRHDEAVAAATRAIEMASAQKKTQVELDGLFARATAHAAAGRPAPALVDARAAIAGLERLREDLIPSDYLKSGFADQYQRLFGFTIGLLQQLGLHEEGLGVSEQARARAFLDVLATRASGGAHDPAVGTAGLEFDSRIIAPLPSAAGAIAEARRRQSTIVSYWIGADDSVAWVVSPAGRVSAFRIPIGPRGTVRSRRPDDRRNRGWSTRRRHHRDGSADRHGRRAPVPRAVRPADPSAPVVAAAVTRRTADDRPARPAVPSLVRGPERAERTLSDRRLPAALCALGSSARVYREPPPRHAGSARGPHRRRSRARGDVAERPAATAAGCGA